MFGPRYVRTLLALSLVAVNALAVGSTAAASAGMGHDRGSPVGKARFQEQGNLVQGVGVRGLSGPSLHRGKCLCDSRFDRTVLMVEIVLQLLHKSCVKVDHFVMVEPRYQ
jgi:hypothetical protein